MQLELDLFDGRDRVHHVRHLPPAPCESPFSALDQIRHATQPADVWYAPNDDAADQIKSGFSHFTLEDKDVNFTYNNRFT